MNPYTEIEFKGKKLGLYYGLSAIAAIGEDFGLMEGINSIHISLGYYASILKGGYDCNCVLERVKSEVTYKDFYLFLEQQSEDNSKIPDDVLQASDTFLSSKMVSERSSNGVLETEKKN